jgi:hypothetical protein
VVSRRGASSELPGALMADEVVPRENVVDGQALGTGEPLADVALEQGLPVEACGTPLVVEQGTPGLPVTGLAGGRR